VKVTSDAGLLTFRELDEAFGFTAMINSKLTDNRACRNTQHSLTALLRQSIFALAYNLGNFLRRLALPKKIRDWSLRTLQVKLIKIGAKVIRHSRYVIFQMAEVAVPRALFREILERISGLRASPEFVRTG